MNDETVISIVKILLKSAEDKLKSEVGQESKPYLEGYRDACKMLLEYLEKK